jgi:hypothetical protein
MCSSNTSCAAGMACGFVFLVDGLYGGHQRTANSNAVCGSADTFVCALVDLRVQAYGMRTEHMQMRRALDFPGAVY